MPTPQPVDEEIAALSFRYATAVDGRDFVSLRTIFTPEAVLESPAGRREGVDAIIDAMSGLRRYRRTQHRIGGLGISITDDGETTAIVECEAHHVVRRDERGGDVDRVMTIHYHDRYERTEEGWRIAARRLDVLSDVERPIDP